MNHSVELLEALQSGVFKPAGTTGATTELYPMWGHLLPQAVAFHGGESDDIRAVTRVPGLYRLPYPTMWAEFERNHPQLGRVVIAVLAVSEPGRMFSTYVNGQQLFAAWSFFRVKHLWSEAGGGFCRADGGFDAVVAGGDDPQIYLDSKPLLMEALQCFASLISAMNCRNVRRVENFPDPKLMKARSKRGKLPFKSFWTLHLRPTLDKGGAELGGTHASPRVHIRRGHPREFRPGHWTWVQHTVVGNKGLGVVEKDYSVARGPAPAAPPP